MTLPIGLPRSTDKARIAGNVDRYPEALLHKSHDLARLINMSFTKAPPRRPCARLAGRPSIRRAGAGPLETHVRNALAQRCQRRLGGRAHYPKFIREGGRPEPYPSDSYRRSSAMTPAEQNMIEDLFNRIRA